MHAVPKAENDSALNGWLIINQYSFGYKLINCRYTRTLRLTSQSDYQRVFQNTTCKSADKYLTVLACRNAYDYPRLGLAITKKKLAKAVARNRIKRLIRDSFRHHLEELEGLDIVVLSHSCVKTTSNKVILDRLHQHWNNLSRRCKKS